MSCATLISRSWRSFSIELLWSTRVLDRERRVDREVGQVLDVGRLEVPHAAVQELEDADDLLLAVLDRHAEDRPRAEAEPLVDRRVEAGVRVGIVDADRLAGLGDRARDPAAERQPDLEAPRPRRHARPDLLAVAPTSGRRCRAPRRRPSTPSRGGCRSSSSWSRVLWRLWLASTRLFWRVISRSNAVRSRFHRSRSPSLAKGPPATPDRPRSEREDTSPSRPMRCLRARGSRRRRSCAGARTPRRGRRGSG